MTEQIKSKVTPEEHKEILELVSELSKICNENIPAIVEKNNLDNLRKFDIITLAVSLQFGCEQAVYEELQSRLKKIDDDNLTYFG